MPPKRKRSSPQLTSPKTTPKKKNSQPTTPSKHGLEFFFGKQHQQVEDDLESTYGPQRHIAQVGQVEQEDLTLLADRERQEREDALFAQQLQEEEDKQARQVANSYQEQADSALARSLFEAQSESTQQPSLKEERFRNNDSLFESSAGGNEFGIHPNGSVPSKAPATSAAQIEATLSTTPDQSFADIPLDIDSFKFDPTIIPRQAFHLKPINPSEPPPIPYSFLVHCFILVGGTASRLKTIDILTNTLRCLIHHDPDSLLSAVWLATNSIAPPYEAIELNLGWAAIGKAIKSLSGQSGAALKLLHDKYGDLGDVAYEAKVAVRTLSDPPSPTIRGVYSTLLKIAKIKGQGTIDQKAGLVKQLMLACKGEEVRYLTRTLISHLRIGAVKTTMLIALGKAFTFQRPINALYQESEDFTLLPKESKENMTIKLKRAEGVLKECYAQRPDYGSIVPALLEHGLGKLLQVCQLTVGLPLKPMLGTITRDLVDMYKKLDGRAFQSEMKYDGQRMQLHCDEEGRVSIFSRHLENMTEKYPDIAAIVPSIRSTNPHDPLFVSSFIMEGEVVAVDPETGALKSFQTLTNRGRKNVALESITVPVAIFAFDLMYLNGESLLKKSFRQRRDLLYRHFNPIANRFRFVEQIESSDPDEVYAFFKKAIERQCEGIMVKVLDDAVPSAEPTSTRTKALLASYEPDKRLESWLKVKKDYVLGESDLGDSLDLVPIAAWHGIGRKTGWWSPFLLASWNEEEGTWDAVCKCISGFTDAFYKEMNIRYAPDSDLVTRVKPGQYTIAENLHPDIWFHPTDVWEIRGADLTLSPVYPSAIGLVSEDRGLSLRFPRFIRTRPDKNPEQATTNAQLADFYRKQSDRGTVGNAGDKDKVDDDGFIEE